MEEKLNQIVGGGSSTVNSYNSWPDKEKWPVLYIEKLDRLDKWEQWFAGSHLCEKHMRRLGLHEIGFRQIQPDTLPVVVRNAMKFEQGRAQYTNWYFYLAGAELTHRTGHLIMFTGSHKTYNFEKKNYRITRPALVVELGCHHEWKHTQPYRCYHTFTCLKCDATYSYDSSD